jgi:hypothetical protein
METHVHINLQHKSAVQLCKALNRLRTLPSKTPFPPTTSLNPTTPRLIPAISRLEKKEFAVICTVYSKWPPFNSHFSRLPASISRRPDLVCSLANLM